MKISIACQDKYEAQKLASLIFVRDSETFITEILNIVGTELVVALKDKSAHSVVLQDAANVELIADFLQSVLEKEHGITGAATSGSTVEITKS